MVGDRPPRGDRPRPPRAGAAGRACTRSTGAPRSSWAAWTGPRPTLLARRARRRAARHATASTPRRRATRCSSSRPSRGLDAGRSGQQARADRPRSPARHSSATRPASSPRSRRRSGASSASMCSPRQANTARPLTLMVGLDELWRRRILQENTARGPTGSATTRSARWPRPGSAHRCRRLLHLRFAPALKRAQRGRPRPGERPDRPGTTPEGGSAGQAVTWYRRAAEAAQELHASGAAVDLLERARAARCRTLPALGAAATPPSWSCRTRCSARSPRSRATSPPPSPRTSRRRTRLTADTGRAARARRSCARSG